MTEKKSHDNKIIQFPIPNRQDAIKKVLDNACSKQKKSDILNEKQITPPKPDQVNVVGNNNLVAGGDMNVQGGVHINTKKITRTKFQPGPEHITEQQGKKIYDTISNLANKEAAGGRVTIGEAKAKWFGMLYGRYQVSTYRAIERRFADEAISWLKQQAAINRPKIRRNNNQMWRNELYGAIYAKARELNMSKAEVYLIVHDRMEKRVSSLTQLNEQSLKKLYNIIMSM